MCTVTVIPLQPTLADGSPGAGGVRIVCNRDEQRSRPPARPPVFREFGARIAVFPIDPRSGGTWIAANDAGLVFVLLNQNDGDRRLCTGDSAHGQKSASRGLVIPSLLRCETLNHVLTASDSLALIKCKPYRLIVVGDESLVIVSRSNGCTRFSERRSLDTPAMFTSSGLGDERVLRCRSRLFDEMFACRDWPEAQDVFHRHSWPGHEDISVAMSRADAHTVSCTIVERTDAEVVMHYYADGPARRSAPFSLWLPIRMEAAV